MNLKFFQNRKFRDFSQVLMSNLVNLISGLILTFIVPKFLTLDDYGYYKIFAFYLGYIGFCNLGFTNGIYILYSNYEYNELPKVMFRTFLKFLTFLQLIISAIIIVISYIYYNDNSRLFIIIFVCINMVLINVKSYYSRICQITRKFKLDSMAVIYSKIIFLLSLSILIYVRSFQLMIYITTISNIFLLLYYILYMRDITIGKTMSIFKIVPDIKKNVSIGFNIMIGDIIALVIFGIDRLFIDRYFSIKDFAIYSFALSILNMIYLVLDSATTVIYPYLARANDDKIRKMYLKIEELVSLLVSIGLISFFIIKIIIKYYLPTYSQSLPLIAVLFPTILFNGQIRTIINNYYRILKLDKAYLINSLVALITAFVFALTGYLIFKTVMSIAISSLITFIVWITYSDLYFAKRLALKFTKMFKNKIFDIIVTISFIITSNMSNNITAIIIYILSLVLLIIIFYNKIFIKDKKFNFFKYLRS